METVMLILCTSLLGAIVFLFLSNKKEKDSLQRLLNTAKENEKQANEKIKKGEIYKKELLEKINLSQKKYKKLESKKNHEMKELRKIPSIPSEELNNKSEKIEEKHIPYKQNGLPFRGADDPYEVGTL